MVGIESATLRLFFWTPDTGLGFDHVTRIRIPVSTCSVDGKC